MAAGLRVLVRPPPPAHSRHRPGVRGGVCVGGRELHVLSGVVAVHGGVTAEGGQLHPLLEPQRLQASVRGPVHLPHLLLQSPTGGSGGCVAIRDGGPRGPVCAVLLRDGHRLCLAARDNWPQHRQHRRNTDLPVHSCQAGLLPPAADQDGTALCRRGDPIGLWQGERGVQHLERGRGGRPGPQVGRREDRAWQQAQPSAGPHGRAEGHSPGAPF
mmetsp:Transcript_49297/g.88041  ORF Transcript_49297/g.88041 Transcript_49297/m.88041 type:complete len:214 (+) Transcript_49297:2598-3239(+)